ncbi:MAG: bifunctional phosphoribosyl-AMP cyclohydrolase/phosphoribosyl-ATP diphosphatase HisIE [Bacteroidales bacterium]|nr:bifunctional phosphoribosyl-AMP cyclohydrolase/phosphoribosyl-ATP diphosphatase HisIE [Bacteroidales bacterium]
MSLNFDKMGGILPAIIQDAQTNEVLMLGFMNQEAYEKTMSEGKVTFYSRTKERLWTKGEESGNFMDVVEILEDCDADTLLIRANPQGPACHTGMRTCFGETVQDNLSFLHNLQALLQSRKEELPENSYTAKLFREGPRKIAKKLGEEATELVIEAMDTDNECFINEAADLLFHMTILLVDRGYRLEDVAKILADRHQSG